MEALFPITTGQNNHISVSTNRTNRYTMRDNPHIQEKDSAMENATLLLLIDSKLDEFKNREMIAGAEVVDFLLDLRNAAASAPHEDTNRELIPQ